MVDELYEQEEQAQEAIVSLLDAVSNYKETVDVGIE